jgi:nucleoside-diphosphate-sugar epimerase
MKILVTGGSGFIGKRLMERLKSLGHEVENFDFINGQDIRDYEHVERAVKGKDWVFHLAAVADLNWAREHPIETMDINVTGTTQMAIVCARHNVFLSYVSTCCVYGNQEFHPSNEKTLPNPAEVYACSKLAGEYVVLGYHSLYNLRYNILRFATIYGPEMRPALAVYVFFDQALKGEPFTVHGDGKQTRTLTYVDDLIDGCIASMNEHTNGEIINLSTEEEISVLDTIDLIKEITGSNSEISFIEQRPGQVFKEGIDASKAKKLINWSTKHGFKEGLQETYKWLKSTNKYE